MFTPWMGIMPQGYAGIAPYAVWLVAMGDYGGTWQRAQWRFDPDTGDVEYRGLAKTLATVTSTSLSIISCVMPATAQLPKPPETLMAVGLTSHTPAVARNANAARLDIAAGTGAEHHVIRWELTSASAVNAGVWLHLNGRWSLGVPSSTAPVAGINSDRSGITPPSNVTLTSTSTGTITAYAWDFDEGFTGRVTPQTASTVGPHTVNYPTGTTGTRVVKLTVTGPLGSSTARFTISLVP